MNEATIRRHLAVARASQLAAAKRFETMRYWRMNYSQSYTEAGRYWAFVKYQEAARAAQVMYGQAMHYRDLATYGESKP